MKSRGGKTFCFVFLLVLFGAAGFFILPKVVWAEEKDLIITEIMTNPEGTDSYREWLEVYNPTKNKIEIKKGNFGLIDEENPKLSKRDGIHYLGCHGIDKNLVIESGKFVILTNSKDELKIDFPDNKFNLYEVSFRLANSKGFIKISNDSCKTFFSENDYNGKLAGEGYSLEKSNFKKEIFKESCILGGTPGKENSRVDKDKYSDDLRINEIIFNSDDDMRDVDFELYNPGEKEDLQCWKIKDHAGETCGLSGEIKKNQFLSFQDCEIKLNKTADEKVILYNPDNEQVSAVEYSKKPERNNSLSFDEKENKYRWSKKATFNNENILNNLPRSKLKIEKKIYKNMLAQFRVNAKDKDKDKLKFVWEFGDGHYSYKQNTSHKYEKKGIYSVSLKISDGSEDVFETFKIEVGKFPKSELKITGVKANPKGKDTDLETIKIKNTSKKKINLKNWSVATGWKDLYNHPVNKKLIIKPGETKELTRKYSKFTLNNKQTKIELRRPDGSVASKVKYSKKEGIQDEEAYEKTENGWEWVGSQTDTDLIRADADEMQTDIDNVENTEEKLNTEENQDNQTVNNAEIQSDEPVENGDVLGAETSRKIEDIGDKPESGSFVQRIIWGANQKLNNLISFLEFLF